MIERPNSVMVCDLAHGWLDSVSVWMDTSDFLLSFVVKCSDLTEGRGISISLPSTAVEGHNCSCEVRRLPFTTCLMQSGGSAGRTAQQQLFHNAGRYERA